MKKLTLMLAFAAATLAVNAQLEGRGNAIKLNPLSLAVLTGNLSYEKAVGPTQSVQLGAFYSGFTISDLKYSGYGITPEFRFYLGAQGEAMNGWYVAPYARYQSFTFEDKTTADKATLSSFGGGAIAGWQKMWPSGFVLDVFAGPGYNAGKLKADDATEDEFEINGGIQGFGVRAGLAIGFGF